MRLCLNWRLAVFSSNLNADAAEFPRWEGAGRQTDEDDSDAGARAARINVPC